MINRAQALIGFTLISNPGIGGIRIERNGVFIANATDTEDALAICQLHLDFAQGGIDLVAKRAGFSVVRPVGPHNPPDGCLDCLRLERNNS